MFINWVDDWSFCVVVQAQDCLHGPKFLKWDLFGVEGVKLLVI